MYWPCTPTAFSDQLEDMVCPERLRTYGRKSSGLKLTGADTKRILVLDVGALVASNTEARDAHGRRLDPDVVSISGALVPSGIGSKYSSATCVPAAMPVIVAHWQTSSNCATRSSGKLPDDRASKSAVALATPAEPFVMLLPVVVRVTIERSFERISPPMLDDQPIDFGVANQVAETALESRYRLAHL